MYKVKGNEVRKDLSIFKTSTNEDFIHPRVKTVIRGMNVTGHRPEL